MERKAWLRILPREAGKEYSSFELYLPAGGERYAQYRFAYQENPPKPELAFHQGPNVPANQKVYRIHEAYVVRKEGDAFVPLFRALQQGEIGFAVREAGSGDAIGGYHGDEIFTDAALTVDGQQLDLRTPFFGQVEQLSFYQRSYINRCNLPGENVMLHTQTYTIAGATLKLSQDVLWVAEGRPMRFSGPMLTAQRLDPERTDRILTDTVELYGPDGKLLESCDTSPYGTVNPVPVSKGDSTISTCHGTEATAAKVYGKHSGFCARVSFRELENTIPHAKKTSFLCIRFMSHALDNKIYFRTSCDTPVPAGSRWRADVEYCITYDV